jgi:Uma2 family endonuclease
MTGPAVPLAFTRKGKTKVWPAQGAWTYADYLRLPDDGRRYEIIRGSLYLSPSPEYLHQLAVTRLSWLLSAFCEEKELGVVLVAPFDVRLPQRISDPVQPDVLFFRRGNEPQPGDKSFSGVPDLVVEVLSPSTRRLDERVKLAAYRDAGVPEVWLVDPQARTVLVHQLAGGEWAVEHGPGGMVASAALAGLGLPVDRIFPAPAPRAH